MKNFFSKITYVLAWIPVIIAVLGIFQYAAEKLKGVQFPELPKPETVKAVIAEAENVQEKQNDIDTSKIQ